MAQPVVLWPSRLDAVDFAPTGQPLAVFAAAEKQQS
jgi:hypothetical protein